MSTAQEQTTSIIPPSYEGATGEDHPQLPVAITQEHVDRINAHFTTYGPTPDAIRALVFEELYPERLQPKSDGSGEWVDAATATPLTTESVELLRSYLDTESYRLSLDEQAANKRMAAFRPEVTPVSVMYEVAGEGRIQHMKDANPGMDDAAAMTALAKIAQADLLLDDAARHPEVYGWVPADDGEMHAYSELDDSVPAYSPAAREDASVASREAIARDAAAVVEARAAQAEAVAGSLFEGASAPRVVPGIAPEDGTLSLATAIRSSRSVHTATTRTLEIEHEHLGRQRGKEALAAAAPAMAAAEHAERAFSPKDLVAVGRVALMEAGYNPTKLIANVLTSGARRLGRAVEKLNGNRVLRVAAVAGAVALVASAALLGNHGGHHDLASSIDPNDLVPPSDAGHLHSALEAQPDISAPDFIPPTPKQEVMDTVQAQPQPQAMVRQTVVLGDYNVKAHTGYVEGLVRTNLDHSGLDVSHLSHAQHQELIRQLNDAQLKVAHLSYEDARHLTSDYKLPMLTTQEMQDTLDRILKESTKTD